MSPNFNDPLPLTKLQRAFSFLYISKADRDANTGDAKIGNDPRFQKQLVPSLTVFCYTCQQFKRPGDETCAFDGCRTRPLLREEQMAAVIETLHCG